MQKGVILGYRNRSNAEMDTVTLLFIQTSRCGVFFFFFFLTQVNKFIDSLLRTKPGQRPAREQRCGGSSSLHVELG
jgi:hypothetical protein